MTLGRLSSSIDTLRPSYDVIVVGSGYGGAVAAARLAGPKRSVCVLERGRELRPGDYPASLPAALRNVQLDLPSRHLFSRRALYDLRLNGDLKVLVGCGLGGTSLINANVVLRPKDPFFEASPWPKAIREEAPGGGLQKYFDRAGKVLKPKPYPCAEMPRKYRALKRIVDDGFRRDASSGRTRFDPTLAPVAVTFPERNDDVGFRLNEFGVMQHPCTGCGDCVSGCNFAAKNTLLMNYLPMARAHGAAIFSEMKVISISRLPARAGDDRRWLVHCEPLGTGRRQFTKARLTIAANTVILGAGALGSTEILLRSRAASELPLSDRLGERFSGNGDVLAFAYKGREIVNGIGAGRRSFHGTEAPGPCISGSVELGDEPAILLQEGVIPGALSPILTLGFVLARLFTGRDPAVTGARRSLWRLIEDYARGGRAATQTFLAMLSDRRCGRLDLVGDRIKVVWSGAGRGPEYDEFAGLVERACAQLDAAYIPSPFGSITVHPLGGCAMADHAGAGVVNDAGAVFTGQDDEIHPGLYVFDGSTIPCALGANPLFTITALAERSASIIQASQR